jgi:hypothetical protein
MIWKNKNIYPGEEKHKQYQTSNIINQKISKSN